MKKVLTSILAIIILVISVTSVSALDCAYASCNGIMYNAGCASSSLDDCDLYEDLCTQHKNCIYQEYYAQTTSVCNVCGFWMYIDGNAHLCSIGHRFAGQNYPFSLSSVCVYF